MTLKQEVQSINRQTEQIRRERMELARELEESSDRKKVIP